MESNAVVSLIFGIVSISFVLWAIWAAVKSGALKAKGFILTIREKFSSEAANSSAFRARCNEEILYQARVSFWFSLIFSALGFLIIFFTTTTTSNLQLVSGIIVESVSALFFIQSHKAKKIMERILMIERISDKDKRDELIRAYILEKQNN